MEKRQERASGIELLRILCMLMIIAHHYYVHGGYAEEQLFTYHWQGMCLQMFGAFGKPACGAFAVMSGYYLSARTGEKHYRRITPLVAEQFFYSIVILAVVVIFHLRAVSLTDCVKKLFPVIWGNWYVAGYILLYMFVPFLNLWMRSMDEKTYARFFLTAIVIWSIIPTLIPNAWGFSNLDFFLVMYFAGGGIRFYWEKKIQWRNRWNLAVFAGSVLLILLSVASLNIIGYVLNIPLLIGHATYFTVTCSPLAILFSMSAFLFFHRLRFFSRAINYLAGSMVGIYLIHDNNYVRELLWQGLSPNAAHLSTQWLHMPVKVLAVFLVCLTIDLLRRTTVEKVFLKWFNKVCAAWDKKHVPSGSKD